MKGHGKIHPKDWSLSKRFEHLLFDVITDIDNIISDVDNCDADIQTRYNFSLQGSLDTLKSKIDDIQNLKDEIYENEIGVEKLKEEIFERAIS